MSCVVKQAPTMSLTIDNQTNWDGRHLRTLCRRIIEHTDGYFHRTIDVRTSKSHRKDRKWEVARKDDETCKVGTAMNMYRGRASIGSRRYLYMGVPKVERHVGGEWLRHEFDEVQFARVLEHEIAHNRGLRHGDMVDDVRYCRQDIDYATDLPSVEPKPSWEPNRPERQRSQ